MSRLRQLALTAVVAFTGFDGCTCSEPPVADGGTAGGGTAGGGTAGGGTAGGGTAGGGTAGGGTAGGGTAGGGTAGGGTAGGGTAGGGTAGGGTAGGGTAGGTVSRQIIEVISGSGRLTGGGRIVDVQIGHAVDQAPTSGGGRTVQGNSAIKR
ncbi:MAG: hypothetical protein Q8L14_30050 [Myxococcales bacterium]|nr:hypothetical protein [Myxococcales bacterium]